MADGREKDSELLSGENWLTDWENQVMDEWQDSDVEERAQHESELTAQKLWLSFQNSASSITQLYRGEKIATGRPVSTQGMKWLHCYVMVLILVNRHPGKI